MTVTEAREYIDQYLNHVPQADEQLRESLQVAYFVLGDVLHAASRESEAGET